MSEHYSQAELLAVFGISSSTHRYRQQRQGRIAPEREALKARVLPPRFDTCYRETRRVALDAFIDVGGNRYSVPANLCGERVVIHRSLDGELKVYDIQDIPMAEHRLRPAHEGWQLVPDHHARLWQDLSVQTRSLTAYEEVAASN